jgi:hypothetical protein
MSRDLQEILSSGEITEVLKGGVTQGDQMTDEDDIQRLRPNHVHFAGNSLATITISADPNNPSFFPLENFFEAHECELFNIPNGEVKNTSGRTIPVLTGTFSFAPAKTVVGTTTLYIVSERSIDDGFSWTPNSESLRTFELNRDQNQFGTKLSMLFDWLPNELVRFKAYAVPSIDLTSPGAVIDGDAYVGPSWFWTLIET